MSLPASATETAAVIDALLPLVATYPWWATIVGILVWAVFFAPLVSKCLDWLNARAEKSAAKWDNKVMRAAMTLWRWFVLFADVVTRNRK